VPPVIQLSVMGARLEQSMNGRRRGGKLILHNDHTPELCAVQREFLSTNSYGAVQWPVIDSRFAGIPEDIHWSRESNFIDPHN
jgi:hypothetical protein